MTLKVINLFFAEVVIGKRQVVILWDADNVLFIDLGVLYTDLPIFTLVYSLMKNHQVVNS